MNRAEVTINMLEGLKLWLRLNVTYSYFDWELEVWNMSELIMI